MVQLINEMNLLLGFLGILIAILLFIAYRLFIYYRGLNINLYYNRHSKIVPLIESIQRFKTKYYPTPWLPNSHAQSIYSMQLRKRQKFENEREVVLFPDGGNAIIDWFHPDSNSPKKNDIIVIFHTLGGGSREKAIHAYGCACAKHGYTAACMNCRGCAGAKLTSEKIYNAYEIDDFKYEMDHHIKTKNPKHIFICGFSMGSMHASRYAVEYPEDITAVVAVSHTMHVEKATKQLEQFPLNIFYLPNIMKSHHRLLKKQHFLHNPAAIKSKNMTELDTVYTAPSLGMKSCYDYWAHMTIYNQIPKFKTPIIELAAEDDPFTRREYFPFKEAQMENNQYMCLVSVKEGGHCGFMEGIKGDHSLVEDISFEWFDRAAKMDLK